MQENPECTHAGDRDAVVYYIRRRYLHKNHLKTNQANQNVKAHSNEQLSARHCTSGAFQSLCRDHKR